MNPIQLGVVGCGDIAGFTALVSRLVPQVRLAACCDVNPERAETFAQRHNISASYTEYTELLAHPGLDSVYLAVPHHLHYDMLCAALEAGKHVFVEKPVTRTLAEATALLEVIQTSGLKVGVNYQYRYDRGCYALARAAQSGSLGEILSVRINIPWRREAEYFDNAPWHKTIAQAGGGTLITQGSHFLDIALWAQQPAAPVSAVGYSAAPKFDVEVDTLTHGIVEMDNGALVSITSSMAAASEQAVTLEIYGTEGTAVYWDKPLPRVQFINVRVRKERPPGWGVHALQRSLAGFAKWILEEQPYLTPADESITALAAVEAIYRSAQSGRKERIDLVS